MCLLTIGIWSFLAVLSIASGFVYGPVVSSIVVLISLFLSIILPLLLNYYRPVVFGWATWRQRLQHRLITDGVLLPEDLDKGAVPVQMARLRENSSGVERGTQEGAFVIPEGERLRVVGEKTCFETSGFGVCSHLTEKCGKCRLILFCGGDGIHLRANVRGHLQDFRLHVRKGNTLRQAARETEMLEGLLSVDASDSRTITQGPASLDLAKPQPEGEQEPLDL